VNDLEKAEKEYAAAQNRYFTIKAAIKETPRYKQLDERLTENLHQCGMSNVNIGKVEDHLKKKYLNDTFSPQYTRDYTNIKPEVLQAIKEVTGKFSSLTGANIAYIVQEMMKLDAPPELEQLHKIREKLNLEYQQLKAEIKQMEEEAHLPQLWQAYQHADHVRHHIKEKRIGFTKNQKQVQIRLDATSQETIQKIKETLEKWRT